MRFSDFLGVLYTNCLKTITRQDVFLRELLKSAGGNFNYTDDYLKRILNGQKPFTADFRKLFPVEINKEGASKYLQKSINPRRIDDLLESYGVQDEEERDFLVFCDAAASQLQNYIQFGENGITTSMEDVYLTLLDQSRNGLVENANEEALCFAKNYLSQGLNAIASIREGDSVLSLQCPFENFFDSIFKVFKVFNARCNRKGRDLLKKARGAVLEEAKPEVALYLSKIVEPGASPVDLVKEITIRVYDNYMLRDRFATIGIGKEEISEVGLIKAAFKQLKWYPVNEIFFTETIVFREVEKKLNLVEFAEGICRCVRNMLSLVQLGICNNYPGYNKYDKAIRDGLFKLAESKTQYTVDGTYYPQTEELEYAITWSVLFGNEDGSSIEPGSFKYDIRKDPLLKGYDPNSFHQVVYVLNSWMNWVWQKGDGTHDPMVELYTFNKDKTCRKFMVSVMSKPGMYRLIRKAAETVKDDKIDGFVFSNVLLWYFPENDEEWEKLRSMTTNERMEYPESKEIMLSVGYKDGEFYYVGITKEASKNNESPQWMGDYFSMKFPFLQPLISVIDRKNGRHKHA